MNKVAFVDTETTGLDPDKHPIWEVGLITPDEREHVWQFPIVEVDADPFALDIGRFWERHWSTEFTGISEVDAIYEAHSPKSRRERFPAEGRAVKPSAEWARYFRDLTAGCHLAGAVVSFDEERLRRLLHAHGVLHRWHYHLIDVEALVVGWLQGKVATGGEMEGDARAFASPPWKSADLYRAVGVDPDDYETHTALGDARLAKAVYEKVIGPGLGTEGDDEA